MGWVIVHKLADSYTLIIFKFMVFDLENPQETVASVSYLRRISKDDKH